MARVTPIAIRVASAIKRYGAVTALGSVSLEFPAGRLTAVLGPSGCGKTTLLRAIAGFATLDAGGVHFDRDDVTALPPQARGTAMVFQSYALWPHMTVFDNVAYGLRLKRVARDEIGVRVRQALALVEIGDVDAIARRKPGALSGGQQQRVALARALVVEPRVLLLDEPLSNLDAKIRQRLRVEIRRLQRRVGITTIYVTHDQEEALAIADQVVLMSAGRVVQTGTPQEVYLKPTTEFAADFLGVGTRLPALAEAGTLVVGSSRLPYDGPERGPVVAVLRSSDLTLGSAGADAGAGMEPGPKAVGAGNPSRRVGFRASEGLPAPTAFGPGPAPASPPAAAELTGELEESLFLGAHWRHYVRVGETVVIVDGDAPHAPGPVRVRVPSDRLRVYPREGGSPC